MGSWRERTPSLRQQARSAMISSTLFSPQSISILLLALFLFAFDISFLGLPAVAWLVFGLVGEILYIIANFTDPKAAAEAVGKMFDRRYRPDEIKNSRARQRLSQALEYYRNIQQFALQKSGALQVQINDTLTAMEEWVGQIYRLARRIDHFEENELITRDRARVPDELAALRRRLQAEPNANVRVELEDAVRLKETQLQNLEMLETNVKRAGIQLENTLAALGTIYTQMQVMDSKDVDGRRAHRLREEIQDEILSLRDTVDAIDDVQSNSFYALSK